MEQKRFEQGTWHGKPIWQCLGCNETLFNEADFHKHWNDNHIEHVTLRATGLVDPRGNDILVEEQRKADELEAWRQRALAAKAPKSLIDELLEDGPEEA